MPAEMPEGMIIMICCLGLFTGFFIGQHLGGPWVVIAPAAGFILGLVGDVKVLWRKRPTEERRACHG